MGQDGVLYVLERSFSLPGFRSRIRRIDPEHPEKPIETILKTPLGAFGNLEGLSVWRTRGNATCATMVSDNNS